MKIRKSARAISRSMRIGIATITSTALVAGTLVAVPAHPLLPVTAVAQAQENVAASQALTAENIATARALGIDLNLLDLEVLDAIEANDAWPNRAGTEDNQLTLELLQSLEVTAGTTSLPLVKNAEGAGLLDLGGNGIGLLGATADAPGVTGISASSGVLAEEGSLNLDPGLNQGTGPTRVDLLALTDQLGLDPAVNTLVSELSLEIGALGSSVEKNGDDYTTDYTVADLELVLESDLLEEINTTLSGVGSGLDQTIEALAGSEGLTDAIFGVLGPVLEVVGIGTPTVNINSNLTGVVDNLITAPLYDGTTPEDSLVLIDLGTGEIRINLEKLHGQDLNGLDPNTPLNTAQIAQITETVDDLLDSLLDRVSNTLNEGILDTALVIELPAEGILGGLLGEIRIESSLGGLLGADGFEAPNITYGGTILSVVGGLLEPAVNGIVRPLGGAIQDLLEDEVSEIIDTALRADVLNSLLTGLTPLLDEVLTEVLAITINRQDDITIDGQPGRRVTALDVQLLPAAGGAVTTQQVASVLQLGLASSQVSGPSTADLNNWAPEITVIPDEGPFGEPQTVTIAGNNLVYVDEGVPTSLVTELTFGEVNIPASSITANADGSLTVEVPAATADAGEERRPVTVTLTTGGGSDTDEFTFVAAPDVDPVAPVITPIADQTGTVGEELAPIDVDVTPADATVEVLGLPAGVTYNQDTGQITGTPTAVGTSDITVRATNDGETRIEEFRLTVTEAEATVPVIGAIDDQTVELGEAITPIDVDVAPADATVEVLGLPTGVTYNEDTGQITGTPDAAGRFNISVTAIIGDETDTETFTLTVTDPDEEPGEVTPVIGSIDDQTGTVGEPITPIDVEVTPNTADVTVEGLPAGVTYNEDTDQITGTPTAVGTFPVTVTAVNGDRSATETFNLTVESDVAAPSIGDIEDVDGTINVPIIPIIVEVTPDDTDVDVVGLPDGVTYDEETGEISGTPTQSGTFTVTVSASNSAGSDTTTFVMEISPADGSGNGSIGDGSSGNGSSDSGNGNGGIDNGSSEFLQQCLSSPAGGLVGLLAALGAVSAIAGPALEPLLKSIGAAVDQQLRQLSAATSGAHQPAWVQTINRGLNDAANAVNHQMVSNALFATAALALVSSPILCDTDGDSGSSAGSSIGSS